jgi:hypothetical protein
MPPPSLEYFKIYFNNSLPKYFFLLGFSKKRFDHSIRLKPTHPRCVYSQMKPTNNTLTYILNTFVCLFSWRYNPFWLYFPQPGSGL